MYRLYATLISFCMVSMAYAQDIIQRTDGVKIEGKILDVKGAEIQFTKKAEDSRNIYIISKEDVVSVTYQDGTVEQYNTSGTTASLSPAASRSTASPDVAVNRGRHILAIRPMDLLVTNLSFIYEHLSANQKFGIRLPLSIGLNQSGGEVYNSFSMLRNRIFSSGLDLNFYIGKPDRFRYYIGPSLQLGFFKYRFYDYRSPTVVEQNRTGTHFALLINNGLWYQISKKAVLGMDLGLGFQKRAAPRTYSYYENSGTPKMSANISAGFQF